VDTEAVVSGAPATQKQFEFRSQLQFIF
jgi:hypothetical protein